MRDDDNDPSIIPEYIKEFVKSAHKERQESRPDEGWRISKKPTSSDVAPYKIDQEDQEKAWESLPESIREEGPGSNEVPNYAEGGMIPDPNQVLQDIAPPGTGILAPSPAQAPNPPAIEAPMAPPPMAAPKAPAIPAAPAPTEQSFMDKASRMLGLNSNDQASFMKTLGDKSQTAQIGAGIAGLGDAIASGGTLGKVNPGALARSEDIIQGKEKAGIEGMQTIRGNQEKTTELSQKLQAQDPNSPVSRYAQKAYSSLGKKLGIDLSHASASIIGDLAGKTIEQLSNEAQLALKEATLGLQKQTLAATVSNQKAEQSIAQEGRRLEAAKAAAGRGPVDKLLGMVPGTTAHASDKVLEESMKGGSGPVKVNSMDEYKALPSGTHYVDSFGTEKVKK